MTALRHIGDLLLGLIYPALCPVCNRKLARGEYVICVHCRWEMPFTDFWQDSDNPLFRFLESDIPNLEQASALLFFHHDSHYRTAIHHLKYYGRRDIARALGELYGRELKVSGLYGPDTVLVPVPLHWSKRIGRGYNQAEEICRGMKKGMGLESEFRSLKRVRRTRTQTRRHTAEQRKHNVEGAFAMTRPERFRNRHILLVDDVITTGSTLKACAEAIARTFPETRISVAALATVRHPLQRPVSPGPVLSQEPDGENFPEGKSASPSE